VRHHQSLPLRWAKPGQTWSDLPPDLRRRLVVEMWEYFRTKIPLAPPDELRSLLRVFQAELRRKLARRPVVRIWPDQWLKFPPS